MRQNGCGQTLEADRYRKHEQAGGKHRHDIRGEQPQPSAHAAVGRNREVGDRDRRQSVESRANVLGDDVRGDGRATFGIREDDERTLR